MLMSFAKMGTRSNFDFFGILEPNLSDRYQLYTYFAYAHQQRLFEGGEGGRASSTDRNLIASSIILVI